MMGYFTITEKQSYHVCCPFSSNNNASEREAFNIKNPVSF